MPRFLYWIEIEKIFSKFARFVVLNPCFVLAAVTAILIAWYLPPELPVAEFDHQRVVKIEGWIARIPEQRNNYIYFELIPIKLLQDKRFFKINGRIAVTINSSLNSPEGFFNPPLEWGEILSCVTFLNEPNFNGVPGTSDRRLFSMLKGIPYRITLKSPLLVNRKGIKPVAQTLLPVFRYLGEFESSCSANLVKSHSALVFSSLFGRKGYLSEEVRKQINRLGISHLFAVSGFHLGIVAFSVFFLLRTFGIIGLVISLLSIWTYVLLVGFPVSAMRAGTIISIGIIGFRLGYKVRLLNILGTSALVLFCIRHSNLFLPSFHFSYGCMLGISLLAIPLSKKLISVRKGIDEVFDFRIDTATSSEAKIYRKIRFLIEQSTGFIPVHLVQNTLKIAAPLLFYTASLLFVAVSIQLFLFPILIYYNNTWSILYLVSNILFIPLFTLLIPITLITLILFWTPLGPFVFRLLDTYSLIILKLLACLTPETDPFFLPQPTQPEILLFYVLVMVSLSLSFKPAWMLRILAISILLLNLSDQRPYYGDLEITMLDMGQAESIHLRYPDGSSGLIDTGSPTFPDHMVSVSERIISRYLWDQRVDKLSYILLTHPERDHIGSFPFISRVFDNRKLLYSRFHPVYGESVSPVNRGHTFIKAGVWHRILHPDLETQDFLKINDSSVVTEIRFGRFSALFTGDITSYVENGLSRKLDPVVLLKIPHHGSRTSSSKLLLSTTRARVAWISAGRRNPFGHPSPKVLKRLQEAGIWTLCTNSFHSLRVRTDGLLWQVQAYSPESKGFVDLLSKAPLPEIDRSGN